MVVWNSRVTIHQMTVRNTISNKLLAPNGIDADYGNTITIDQATVTDNAGAGISLKVVRFLCTDRGQVPCRSVEMPVAEFGFRSNQQEVSVVQLGRL